MTAPEGYSGIEPVTAEGIHEGGPDYSLKAPFTQKQLRAIADSLLYRIGAWILYALAGIEVLGQNPFGFLRGWADDLNNRANDAYANASNASSAAANAASANQSTAARVGILDIPGGVSITDGFAQAAGPLPNPPYTAHFAYGGSGQYVTNGDGLLVWSASGTSDRANIYSHDTLLGTDNGFVTAVFEKRPDVGAQNNLIGRWGSTGHIRLSVEQGFAGIQRVTSTTIDTIVSVAIDLNKDVDVWEFWFGTQLDPTALWVVRNGTRLTALDITDAVHTIDASHRTCAIGGMAKGYSSGQRKPAEINSWTFADQNV